MLNQEKALGVLTPAKWITILSGWEKPLKRLGVWRDHNGVSQLELVFWVRKVSSPIACISSGGRSKLEA